MKNFIVYLLTGVLLLSCTVARAERGNEDTSIFQSIESSYVYIQRISQWISQVKEKLTTFDTLQANQLYLQTYRVLGEYFHKLSDITWDWVRVYHHFSTDPEVERLVAQLEECGIEVRYIGSGEWNLSFTQYFYYNLFKDYVSEEFRDFIRIKADQDEMISPDGEIVVPWEYIGSRLMAWDIFMEKYPSSIFMEEAIGEYSTYMHFFLFGDVHSPAWYGDGIIENDIRLVFDAFLKKHPNTKSAKILTFYLNEIESNGGKVPSDIERRVTEFMRQLIK